MRTRRYTPVHGRLRVDPPAPAHVSHVYNLLIFAVVIIMLLLMANGSPLPY